MFENESAYRDFTSYEVEAFSYWFRFLQLTDKASWSDNVTHDFGVLNVNFEDWWSDHNYLFEIIRFRTIDFVNSVEDFEAVPITPPSKGDPGVIVLAVWMNQTKKDLRKAFNTILANHHQSSSGKPIPETIGEFYQLAVMPDLNFLNKVLEVYKCFTKDQMLPLDWQMNLWEIEEEVSKTIPLIDKTSKFAEVIWQDKNPTPDILEARRKSQCNTVQKYLIYANSILANVVNGKFPIYKLQNKKTTQ